MSAREPLVFQGIADIKGNRHRNLCIDDVGVKGMRYPLTIDSAGKPMPAIATLALTAGLSARGSQRQEPHAQRLATGGRT